VDRGNVLIERLEGQSYLDRLKSTLPELPDQSRARLTKQYGISVTDVDTLLGMDDVDGQGIEYFEDVVTKSGNKTGKRVVNW
jgi:Asp-tRNA(Asn)/Glu-tRNA(Gln) amidotransferase B subunit